MSLANSIRAQLTEFMQTNKMTISQFADRAGMNSGTLSRILQGSRPISMNQLGCISYGMGVPEDHFFEDYVHECFAFTVSTRRIRPFLKRCAELARLDCMEKLLAPLLDDLSHLPILFELAEYCYSHTLHQAAILLYQYIAEAEKLQHSERLALCHYRLFKLSLGENLTQNLRAAILFEPYVRRLNEVDQLDATRVLSNIFAAVHQWDNVYYLSQSMLDLAKAMYELDAHHRYQSSDRKTGERPLYFYILYAQLMKSTAYEHCGNYDKALEYVRLYQNGRSWVRERDEQAEKTMRQFEEWAEANIYLYRLLSGDVGVLPEYVEYVAARPDEIHIALSYIVQVANRFNLDIDDILTRFSDHLSLRVYKTEFGEYDRAMMNESYATFLGNLGIYYLKRDRAEALPTLLEGLKLSTKIKSSRNMATCITLLEHLNSRQPKAAFDKQSQSDSSHSCRLYGFF